MRLIISLLTFVSILGVAQAQEDLPYRFPVPDPANELTVPFDARVDAGALIDLTLARAEVRGVPALLIFGANWCHDSQGFVNHLAEDPSLTRIVRDHYELAFINVGVRTNNIEQIQWFGVPSVIGTPTLVIVSPEGEVLNRDTVDHWRAANRAYSSDIEAYLARYAELEVEFDTDAVASVDMDQLISAWSSYAEAMETIQDLEDAGEIDADEAQEQRRYTIGMGASLVRYSAGMEAAELERPIAMISDLDALGITSPEDVSDAVQERMNTVQFDILERRLIDHDQTARSLNGEVGYPEGYTPPSQSSSEESHEESGGRG